MSDFEPFDDELAGALRRRAGTGAVPTAAAHDAVLHRAGAIRRRRAAIGGGGAMAVLALGGVLLLPGAADEIGPAVTGDVLASFEESTTSVVSVVPVPADDTSDDAGDNSAPATVDLSIPAATTPTSAPGSAVTPPTTSVGSSTPGAASPTVPAPSTSVPTTSAPTSSTTPTSAPSTSSPSTSSPSTSSPTSSDPSTSAPSTSSPTTSDPEPTLAPFTNTYQSAGGSITVRWDGSALSLQSVSPVAGFVADVENTSPTRVRVRFESDDDDSRIEVRVSGGQVLVDID